MDFHFLRTHTKVLIWKYLLQAFFFAKFGRLLKGCEHSFSNGMSCVTSEHFIRICAVYFVVIRCVRQNCLWIVLGVRQRNFLHSIILYHRYSHKRWRKALSVPCSQASHDFDYVTSGNIICCCGKFDDNASIVNQTF